jgi:hypothetical protein
MVRNEENSMSSCSSKQRGQYIVKFQQKKRKDKAEEGKNRSDKVGRR